MELEKRPEDKYIIRIIGDVLSISVSLILPKTLYGIKLTALYPFKYNDQCVLIDLNNDSLSTNEVGSLAEPHLWRIYRYPEDRDKLLTELCNESKRRFEASYDARSRD